MIRKNGQQGVVLISALIFLLLISLLVYVALHKSTVEQQKSNADIERQQAEELAFMALKDAENDIMGRDFKGVFCGKPGVTCAASDSRVSVLKSSYAEPEDEIALPVIALKNSVGTDGVYQNVQQNCTKATGTANTYLPFWQCVDWVHDVEQKGDTNYALTRRPQPIDYGDYTGATVPDGMVKPQYVIELFDGSDFGQPAVDVVIRVTAIGYVPSGDDAWTTSMLQATYSII